MLKKMFKAFLRGSSNMSTNKQTNKEMKEKSNQDFAIFFHSEKFFFCHRVPFNCSLQIHANWTDEEERSIQ
jgi:hypothetical protein